MSLSILFYFVLAPLISAWHSALITSCFSCIDNGQTYARVLLPRYHEEYVCFDNITEINENATVFARACDTDQCFCISDGELKEIVRLDSLECWNERFYFCLAGKCEPLCPINSGAANFKDPILKSKFPACVSLFLMLLFT